MPKLNVPALKKLIEEQYGGVQQRFLDSFSINDKGNGLTRKTIGKWYADGIVSDKRMRELCEHFSVDESVLDLEKNHIDIDKFLEVYQKFSDRAEHHGVKMTPQAIIKWADMSFKSLGDDVDSIDFKHFDLAAESMPKQEEN